MANALSNPVVTINNVVWAVVPNSVSFTEGLGEQTIRTQSAGGGSVEQVYSNDVTTNMSMFKMQVFPVAGTIDNIRILKTNGNANAITVTGDGLTRSFSNMALTSNYEVNLGSDTTIDLEFTGNPSI